ncbi:unnamed protein product [Mytilus coruscus]|uniref:Mab-21-like HhH/H2TH-like domain-containing protein n=1 Tax=Mytilus coruscus TaxID=42192 RepID=A0A6J8D418_MYTCO|nr:unnamed protein product [Mytilus coruscus]
MEGSKQLYHCLCESIGTEEVVKIRRQYYASVDTFMERTDVTLISSGSKAEGLEMGSDFDAMLLLSFVIINEKTNDDPTIPNRFVMDTEDCNPGFTQLKGHSHKYSSLIYNLCVTNEKKYRIESGDVRLWFLSIARLFTAAEIHGPCVSDNRTLDVLPALRCQDWVQQAQPWIYRARYWPPPSLISHYNLFEHRFNKYQQLELIQCLSDVCLKGIVSFRNCETLSKFFNNTFVFSKMSKTKVLCCKMNTLNTLNSSAFLRFAGMASLLNTNLKCQYSSKTTDRGRFLIRRYLNNMSNSFVLSTVFSRFCQHNGKTMDITINNTNKHIYRLRKQYLPYFILGTNADSVCGWLYLATYFYCSYQYKTALQLISHASLNCTPDNLFQAKHSFDSNNLHEIEKTAIRFNLHHDRYVYKRHTIDEISFYLSCKVVPQEIGIQATYQAYITPPVYATFLRFLCLYRLKQDSACIAAIQDMIKASKDKHFNPDNYSLSENFNCIATAFVMVGDTQKADSYFRRSKEIKEEYGSFYFDPNLIPI